MGIWDPEWITAVGGFLIGALVLIFGKGKSKPVDDAAASSHYAASAEARKVDALEEIADSIAKIERNVDLFVDRQRSG